MAGRAAAPAVSACPKGPSSLRNRLASLRCLPVWARSRALVCGEVAAAWPRCAVSATACARVIRPLPPVPRWLSPFASRGQPVKHNKPGQSAALARCSRWSVPKKGSAKSQRSPPLDLVG
eukprot:15481823-Alexandrium_andersonii.AAC.1